ncbi:MAG: cyclic nucleotide-binding domain-containing protein, partial [Candidatus Latescibacterota bacterium]
MIDAALVERLARHQTVGAAPRDQLEWLVSHGRLRRLAAGEVMFKTGDSIDSLFVVLSGHLSIRVD